MTRIDWSDGTWTHAPAAVREDGSDLWVEAVEGSDAWRVTSYGFIHDTEHALLANLPVGDAMEVAFIADFAQQFDQAGLFVRVDDEHWVKAGVEFADGMLGLGAVVTDIRSDWSIGDADAWRDRTIRVRVSRGADALTVRAAVDDGPFRLVRVAPFPGDAVASAGPFVCAPTRAGLIVHFTDWQRTDADHALH